MYNLKNGSKGKNEEFKRSSVLVEILKVKLVH